jgi:hypothetical protein
MASIQEVAVTVDKHIRELRRLANLGLITTQEHDAIGKVLCAHMGDLIGLGDNAWLTFKRIIEESRAVHYGRPPKEILNDH